MEPVQTEVFIWNIFYQVQQLETIFWTIPWYITCHYLSSLNVILSWVQKAWFNEKRKKSRGYWVSMTSKVADKYFLSWFTLKLSEIDFFAHYQPRKPNFEVKWGNQIQQLQRSRGRIQNSLVSRFVLLPPSHTSLNSYVHGSGLSAEKAHWRHLAYPATACWSAVW